MKTMAEASPAPLPRLAASPLTLYREALSRGELAYQADAAGQAVFYPRVTPPNGCEGELHWMTSRGLGTVYATTFISPRGEAAYNVALIDMDEGFRLMSRVESAAPADVRIGMRVRMRIHPGQGEEAPYPVFDPSEEA